MKKITFILFLFAGSSVFAQQAADKSFNLLFTAGLTACQVHGDSYDGFNKLGGTGGLYVESPFAKKFSASLGIIFIQKGARHNQDPPKGDFHYYNLSLNYVEVPLLLSYKVKKFLVDAGLSAGYLINYHEANEVGDITGYSPFRKMEYSVKIGLGYNISEKWFVNVRSSNSFVTIRKYQAPSNIYYNNFIARKFNKGLYNNILEITLGYRLKPHKKSGQ